LILFLSVFFILFTILFHNPPRFQRQAKFQSHENYLPNSGCEKKFSIFTAHRSLFQNLKSTRSSPAELYIVSKGMALWQTFYYSKIKRNELIT